MRRSDLYHYSVSCRTCYSQDRNNMASQSPPTQSPSHEVRAFQIFIIIPSHSESAIHRCKWTTACKITIPVSLHLCSPHPTRYAPFRFSSLFCLMQKQVQMDCNMQNNNAA